MSHFTDGELAYLRSQRLGRLATITPEGTLQNAPVVYRYNPQLDVIEISGHRMSSSKKFRNIQSNPNIAFVIDDVVPPWNPRAVEIRGVAEAIVQLDGGADTSFIRITPRQIVSFGIDSDAYKPNSRKVNTTGG